MTDCGRFNPKRRLCAPGTIGDLDALADNDRIERFPRAR